MKKIITVILFFVCVNSVIAQEIQDFNLLDVLSGKTVSLKNYSSSPGIVIIFMVNNCPFDEYYSSRIQSLGNGKLPVLLVNSHPDANETSDKMITCSNQRGLSIPYLADKDQVLMKSLGANKSTEAFLLKNTGGKFSIVYQGAIDDNPQVAADVKQSYLKDAITKTLNGESIDKAGVRPVGCNIRKK